MSAQSTTESDSESVSGDGGDISLENLGERLRSSTPQDLLALADRLDETARRREIAHVADIIDEDDDEQEERIRLYPSQLRLHVDAPAKETKTTLGDLAHLVETSHDGDASIYETEPLDIWTSPYQHARKPG